MQVILSGYNVDKGVLDSLKEGTHDGSNNVTPEVLSAAYARISRDPRSVNILRDVAREEVEKARKSNKNIVFGMGHHSVAEHAAINFDIVGISRLAIEALEHHRLCSYTEKSQRYITLEGDYVTPTEFFKKEQKEFHKLIKTQNDFYFAVLPELIAYQEEKHPEMTKNKKSKNTLEGWAKEDARYALSLATEAQLGFTANARNLEKVIRKFKYHDLAEVRELGDLLYEQAHEVVPSLIILADEKEFKKTQGMTLDDAFFKHGEKDIKEATTELLKSIEIKKEETTEEVRLINHNLVDREVITSLIKEYSNLDLEQTREVYRLMYHQKRLDYMKRCLKNLGKFDSLPRAFEQGQFTFDLIMSSTCFAQMKRHRMATLLVSDYNPNLGITIPESIKDINQEKGLQEVADKSTELYEAIKTKHPESSVANYCLTNAHRRRLTVGMNLRELYHFSRMRQDSHAQWDIREKAQKMVDLAKKTASVSTMLLAGKDTFEQVKEEVFE